MNSNKSKEECITWLSLHGLTTSCTLQEIRMQINKFQLYPLLDKKLKIKNEKKKMFNANLDPLEIPPRSSGWFRDYGILLKVTPSVFLILGNSRKFTQCWQVGRLFP